MRYFTHEEMQDATREPRMAHQASVAKLQRSVLSSGGLAIDCIPKTDWVRIVDRFVSEQYLHIALLEQQRSGETCHHRLTSIDERINLLKCKLEKRRARLLASMLKMEHVMSRFAAARVTPIAQ